MIYLLDDKKNRQRDYGWDEDIFAKYESYIRPIYTFSEIKNLDERKELFRSSNTVLFHESFFESIENIHSSSGIDIRNRLIKYLDKNKDFIVAIFSGSKESRSLNDNLANLPVAALYQNLETFIKKVAEGDKDIRYLLFGINYKIEEELHKKLESANNEIGDYLKDTVPDSNNFIARSLNKEIEDIFENAVYETFYLDPLYDNVISDRYLSDKVFEWFSSAHYDNIFIPLCFGPTLSDFNGLRMALHIRTSNTINQLSNIFIYSFVDISGLINNEYFDVLKTKNISLIEYKKHAFSDALELKLSPYKEDEISTEIRKIKLNPPKNYIDDHSIANEWAIYRWASVLESNNKLSDEISSVVANVEHHLYFKYLRASFPKKKLNSLSENDLKINHTKKANLLFIDDEADKGWYKLFSFLLSDLNNQNVEYLDSEFNSKDSNQIIEISLQKIKDINADIVILDLRLHADDFELNNIKNTSGFRLLKRIKSYNPGIQVLVFSATQKVWNLQALNEAEVDGFILKESPLHSYDDYFTKKTIQSFIKCINMATQMIFLKNFFISCDRINTNLSSYEGNANVDFNDFINDLKKQIQLIKDAGKKININQLTSLDIVFINCFNFLEKFKNYYVNFKGKKVTLGKAKEPFIKYVFDVNQIKRDDNARVGLFSYLVALFKDYFSITNSKSIENLQLYNTNKARNDFIHNNKLNFTPSELITIVNLCKKITSNLRE